MSLQEQGENRQIRRRRIDHDSSFQLSGQSEPGRRRGKDLSKGANPDLIGPPTFEVSREIDEPLSAITHSPRKMTNLWRHQPVIAQVITLHNAASVVNNGLAEKQEHPVKADGRTIDVVHADEKSHPREAGGIFNFGEASPAKRRKLPLMRLGLRLRRAVRLGRPVAPLGHELVELRFVLCVA